MRAGPAGPAGVLLAALAAAAAHFGASARTLAHLGPPGPAATQEEFFAALQRARELAKAGDFEGAIATLREADLQSSRPAYRKVFRLQIGEFQRALGHCTQALATLDGLAAELGEDQYDQTLRCYLLAVRAQVLLDWGLIDVAARDARRARELLRALEADGDPTPLDAERVQVDYVEATILTSREDYGELELLVAEALRHEVYARHPSRAAMLSARLGLGLKEAARLAPELASRARTTLEQALESEALPALERVLPELALAELALREHGWDAAQAWIERAGANLGPPEARAALPQHASWLALEARLAFERDDRPREPDGAARLTELRSALRRAAEARLEEWSRREPRPGGYGFLQYAEARSLLSEGIRLELALDGTVGVERALEGLLRAGDASTLARRLDAGRTDLRSVREELLGPAAEHALLVYFPAPDRSHLFVVDRERVLHHPLEPHDVLQEARLAVVEALEGVQRTAPSAKALMEWHRTLERLAQLLLPPAARTSVGTRSRLTTIGLDLLGELPFEALPLASERCLGTAFALSHLPSAAVGRALAARAAREDLEGAGRSAGEVLLLAAPSGAKLSLTREEAAEILAPYPARARRLAFGAEASVASLRATSGARVLELFTHGAHDADRERPRTFLLAAPGDSGTAVFGADEVETLDAPALVVLAVCRSGQGPKRRGDAGTGELAGAFFLAGERTRCVVASAFDLEVEATRRLSRAFHAALSAGAAPDEALRAARAELARIPRFADSRFHGLLGAFGDARRPLFPR